MDLKNRPNEMWSYGEEAFGIMRKFLEMRLSLKPYLLKIMREAHEAGDPLMRTMFYEFPRDEKCWELSDQYMFGPEYLVAPVMHADQDSRSVYLPAGAWRSIADGKKYDGCRTVECSAPIDVIPVFQKVNP